MEEYAVDFIYAKMQVNIQNTKIIDFDILEHKNECGKTTEAIIKEIINQ